MSENSNQYNHPWRLPFAHIALLGIFAGIYSLDWFSRVLGILPTQVRWLPETLIVLLLVYVFLLRSANGKLILRKTPIDRYFIGLVIVGLFSMIINLEPLFTALSGFRNLLRPLLLYYVIINLELKEKYLKRLVILLFIMEFLQIPVILYQFFAYGGGDLSSGTLGYSSGNMTVVLALIFMALLLGLAIVYKSTIYALIASFLFLAILFSEGKAGFFMAPSMLLFMFGFIVRPKDNIKTRIFALLKYVVIFIPLFVIVYALSLWLAPIVIPDSQILSFLENPATIFDRYEAPLSKTNDIPRSRSGDIQFAWLLISQQNQYTLLGYGPGAASNGIQGIGVGDLYNRYALDPAYLFGEAITGFTFYAFTQVSVMLQEFGVLGLVLYLLMLFSIFRRNLKFAKRSDTDPFWRGISLGFNGAWFIFVASSVYYRVWFWEAGAYVFWGLAAVLYTLDSSPKSLTIPGNRKGKVGLSNG
jgi:hypothetical protein